MFYLVFAVADSLVEKGLKIWKLSLSPFQQIAHLNRPWSIGCIALSFLVRQLLTRTAFYWPSTIKYQPFPLHTDPVSPSTNQHRFLLAHYHQYHDMSKYSKVRLSFVDLRWAQLYVSLVLQRMYSINKENSRSKISCRNTFPNALANDRNRSSLRKSSLLS